MFGLVRQEKRYEYKEKCTVRCQETVQQWYNLTMCNNQVCFCLNKTMLLSSCLWGNNITTLIMQLDWRITDVTDQCPEVICARQGGEVATSPHSVRAQLGGSLQLTFALSAKRSLKSTKYMFHSIKLTTCTAVCGWDWKARRQAGASRREFFFSCYHLFQGRSK